MRAWYTKDMSCGLLYSCVLGNVRPDCPVALINNRLQDGSEIMEVIPMEHQLPAQRQQVSEGALHCCRRPAFPCLCLMGLRSCWRKLSGLSLESLVFGGVYGTYALEGGDCTGHPQVVQCRQLCDFAMELHRNAPQMETFQLMIFGCNLE